MVNVSLLPESKKVPFVEDGTLKPDITLVLTVQKHTKLNIILENVDSRNAAVHSEQPIMITNLSLIKLF